MPTPKDNNENILALNPLTLIFISGVATHLFISLCCTDEYTGYTFSPIKKRYTDRRMNRWQKIFYQLCLKFFNDRYTSFGSDLTYKIEHQEFQSASVNLNPYRVHSNLLIAYSIMMLDFLKHNKIGLQTINKFVTWFVMMNDL